MINLIENAKQASEKETSITVKSKLFASHTHIKIIDQGSGIQNSDNLFVPFYTTKPNGQGIGLVLSRNIIEQHGGKLTLVNTPGASGVTAQITLPGLIKFSSTVIPDPRDR